MEKLVESKSALRRRQKGKTITDPFQRWEPPLASRLDFLLTLPSIYFTVQCGVRKCADESRKGKRGPRTPWRSGTELCQGTHQTRSENPGTQQKACISRWLLGPQRIPLLGLSAHELLPRLLRSFLTRSGFYGFCTLLPKA